MTDWTERGEIYTGMGQHVLLVVRSEERTETSLLELQGLEFDAVD